MEHFAGYGFNKSHSTAYAFLAYQTAYLKANYPWHFAAALLTIEAQNTDKLALYLGECRDRGIPGAAARHQREPAALHGRRRQGRPLRPDRDQERRRGRDRVAARGPRRSRGAITSLHALCEDLDLRLVNKRVFESLVEGRRVRFARAAARAYDGAAVARAAAAAAGRASTRRASTARACSAIANEGQAQLFGGVRRRRRRRRGDGADGRRCPTAAPWTETEQLGVREGDARSVLERPSGRSLRRRAEGVRRARRRPSSPTRRSARRATTRGGRAAASRSSPTPASAASSPPAAS